MLSGGGALGAYQAGAYAALEKCGVRPNWIAGTGIGAINAAIIAGNPPHERVSRLRQFWQELSKRAAVRHPRGPARWVKSALATVLLNGPSAAAGPAAKEEPLISGAQLRALIGETIDFERINSGTLRVVFGAVNLTTGAETFFDNDRHLLCPDHVLAGSPLPGLPPVDIEGQLFGGSAVAVLALQDARPADTLCFVIDSYDPVPGAYGGISRTAREITAMRHTHDLRRRIALLGEKVPVSLRGDIEVRRCLSEASKATMTILHLVHEVNPAEFVAKMADFSPAAVMRRWRAGEGDIGMSLAHPRWLAPPPRHSGIVVHEVRGGLAAPPR